MPSGAPGPATFFAGRPDQKTIQVTVVQSESWSAHRKKLSAAEQSWALLHQFEGKPGQFLLLPSQKAALLGVAKRPSLYDYAVLSEQGPAARYQYDSSLSESEADKAALGFGLALYQFDRYKTFDGKRSTLVWPKEADRKEVLRLIEAQFLGRDLINTPAEDMGPSGLSEAAQTVAREHGARFTCIVGDRLLEKNYPTVHTVGRAASDAPRLIDFRWGKPKHPKLTLVGKGVCFDSGGLDLKPANGMLLMKKDMGGSAIVLSLAHAIMSARLPVRLRVLIPAVENAVSGNAFRPLDVIRTRSGLTVEVGNTDAEGRLILCDALTEAASEKPDLIVDCATLTGAARIALGTDLPALFSTSDDFAHEVLAEGEKQADPFWRMPLFEPYRRQLDSRVADLSNIGGSYGGAITAALFLKAFVPSGQAWAHVDVMAWNLDGRAGRPKGGEPMGMRTLYQTLKRRYATETM